MGSTALHEDSGDESDPEDSETPWSCVVSVQRIGSSPLGRSGSATTSTSGSGSRDPHSHSHHRRDKEPGVRIKVATLSPSPHHPKVVALLKMPFPLPDIEVEKLVVHKRVITSHGVNRMVPVSGELVLTAEEIKDSISSTALWLIVREGFGGVGKVSRKGDGWRIRA
ncbi:hypothetical protein SERLA73DRAFT_187665 [Serpula lacrymans var. lacrymans S7.3]|uniref:Uncharacterized protein n=2 Tax=Serpula lacrymans var. lacrymans TaxID=341189 RepID=F8QA46_SERL3|nr:uncharacterized protein SERLADRAFT_477408 [Serpula lacrymans var. lacrymans S7.9]EGN94636.1 hypothetical protein SERLA73DRAFT_187665 [Serpula lacrymans var. lacrymans S7.3]EGO20116.1 hypothetical protein SERLADRAFT_477408 [Serpula lacrymans var. lacrymans S7.9]